MVFDNNNSAVEYMAQTRRLVVHTPSVAVGFADSNCAPHLDLVMDNSHTAGFEDADMTDLAAVVGFVLRRAGLEVAWPETETVAV
jgi:hypothetical protein